MTAYEIAMMANRQQPATTPEPAPVAPAPVPVPVQAAPTPASDILERAMLVQISLGIPGNEKVCRKLTQQVGTEHNMGKKWGKADLYVFPDWAYKKISKPAGAVRTWHYANTLPYPLSGVCILPGDQFQTYTDYMRQARIQFEKDRDAFIESLPEIAAWAKVEHNGSFDASLYEPAKIKAKFSFDITFSPIPASSQWTDKMRSILGTDAGAVDDLVHRALEEAEAELWSRLAEPLRNIQTVLGKKENGDRTKITDSLIENAKAIADLIPAMNINGNPKLAEFASEARAAFAGMTSEGCAKDGDKRRAALKAADDILRKMQGAC